MSRFHACVFWPSLSSKSCLGDLTSKGAARRIELGPQWSRGALQRFFASIMNSGWSKLERAALRLNSATINDWPRPQLQSTSSRARHSIVISDCDVTMLGALCAADGPNLESAPPAARNRNNQLFDPFKADPPRGRIAGRENDQLQFRAVM